MKTLILPCAGKSSRFPNMKPKYLLTHPDGKIMVEKAIEGINSEIFDRIIITIVKKHDDDYDSSLILKQIFHSNTKVEICILEDFTSSASETIYKTIKKMNIEGSFVIKDSDNFVEINLPNTITNSIVGLNVNKNPSLSNIAAKSFLIVNEQNLILDIIEKQVVSNIICLGVYCFQSTEDFTDNFEILTKENIGGEMFISHVISFMLNNNKNIFELLMAKSYKDWGTLKEWQEEQNKYRTYFVDVDGVLLKNSGRYGKINWSNNSEIIANNINILKKLQENGAQIVITTARTENFREQLTKILSDNGLKPHAIVMGLNHSTRVLINDFATSNPYPSAMSISLPRNSDLENYFH